MKEIYLTEQSKKELESKIDELEKTYREYASWEEKYGELNTLKYILLSATILPIEESWDDVPLSFWHKGAENIYPKGLIIKPKL